MTPASIRYIPERMRESEEKRRGRDKRRGRGREKQRRWYSSVPQRGSHTRRPEIPAWDSCVSEEVPLISFLRREGGGSGGVGGRGGGGDAGQCVTR